MKYFLIHLLVLALYQPVIAQTDADSLTLEYLYEQLEMNHPIASKEEIQKKITEINLDLIQSNYLPDLFINASGSYQSDVTELPFIPAGAPQFSKDHYKIALEVNQSILDWGRTKSLSAIESFSGSAELASIESELWNRRKQLEEIYFALLLLQKQKAIIDVHIQTIEKQLESVSAQVSNGIILPTGKLVMEAEQIKNKQQLIQINENIGLHREMITLLTGVEADSLTSFKVPKVNSVNSVNSDHKDLPLKRPELAALKAKKNVFQSQIALAKTAVYPTLSAFANFAYGRPGLNAFEDDLQTYWIVGLRSRWNFKGWNNYDRKKSALLLMQKKVDADMETLSRKFQNEIKSAQNKINVLSAQLKLDRELYEIRAQITLEKEAQLEQGVITSTEYLTELNAEQQAKLNFEIRKLKLIQAKIEYLNAKGLKWN